MVTAPNNKFADNRRYTSFINLFATPDAYFVDCLSFMAEKYDWRVLHIICEADGRSFAAKICTIIDAAVQVSRASAVNVLCTDDHLCWSQCVFCVSITAVELWMIEKWREDRKRSQFSNREHRLIFPVVQSYKSAHFVISTCDTPVYPIVVHSNDTTHICPDA